MLFEYIVVAFILVSPVGNFTAKQEVHVISDQRFYAEKNCWSWIKEKAPTRESWSFHDNGPIGFTCVKVMVAD